MSLLFGPLSALAREGRGKHHPPITHAFSTSLDTHAYHVTPAPTMPAQPGPVRAQTIKQAKASYKARSGAFVSEAEKRTLERAVELDRRAWRTKEAEKKRAEAARKRAEKEKKEREEVTNAALGSQRRMDKFGNKSSQMHLGAFLKKPLVGAQGQKENVHLGGLDEDDEFGEFDISTLDEDDEFGHFGMEEQMLLESLDGAAAQQTTTLAVQPPLQVSIEAGEPVRKVGNDQIRQPISREPIHDSFEDFFDELGSSTQIARELDADEPMKKGCPQNLAGAADPHSFDTDDFDLTLEELAELNAIPLEQTAKAVAQSRSQVDRKLMPPPVLPSRSAKPPQRAQPSFAAASAAINDSGFTLSQLEQLVDDDLQLSQTDHG